MSFRNKGYRRLRILVAITQHTTDQQLRDAKPALSNVTGPHAQLFGFVQKRGKTQPGGTEGEEFFQKLLSYVQCKHQSSREKGAGYIAQAVVTLLGFGK